METIFELIFAFIFDPIIENMQDRSAPLRKRILGFSTLLLFIVLIFSLVIFGLVYSILIENYVITLIMYSIFIILFRLLVPGTILLFRNAFRAFKP